MLEYGLETKGYGGMELVSPQTKVASRLREKCDLLCDHLPNRMRVCLTKQEEEKICWNAPKISFYHCVFSLLLSLFFTNKNRIKHLIANKNIEFGLSLANTFCVCLYAFSRVKSTCTDKAGSYSVPPVLFPRK